MDFEKIGDAKETAERFGRVGLAGQVMVCRLSGSYQEWQDIQ